MLSILIPVYNFDIRKFISQLCEQAEKEDITYEIIVADDNSDKYFAEINKEIENLPNVKYILLDKNIGRSKIRNFLAEKAKYEYLLFADCDMLISGKNFIRNYLKSIKKNDVIIGGIEYQTNKPGNSDKYLRWHYGRKREALPPQIRNKKPYSSFMSGNFLIPAEIFNKIKFNENITEYGHEDTLFGIELKRRNFKILHIDNVLMHIGLEDAAIFINKTKISIKNLIYISEKYKYPEFYENIKLLKVRKKLKFLKPVIFTVFKISEKMILKNLYGKKPSLILFDLFKIGTSYKSKIP